MPFRFTPPTYRARAASDRLFGRYSFDVGQTLLKFGSSYRLHRFASADDVEAADVAYLGGHVYIVSDAEAAALTAAGYGSLLAPVVSVDPGDEGWPFPSELTFPGEDIFPFGAAPQISILLFPSTGLFPGTDVNPGEQ